jgi:ubiquinone/menaquinone biosynthesis C-methylase UbiE
VSAVSSPELDARQVAESWSAVAAGYEAYWSPRLQPYLAKAVATFHPVPPGPLAVAGCGPGREVLLLANTFPKRAIVAVDVAADMLGILRRDLRACGIARCVATLGEAEHLSAHVRQAAGVLSAFTLEHLPNPLAALADWSRCLRAGGSITAIFWARPRPGSPHYRLHAALTLESLAGRLLWEARALEAIPLLGLRLVRDERVSYPMDHESPGRLFDAWLEAGALRVFERRHGKDVLDRVRVRWTADHGLRRKGSEWTDKPEARLWVLERVSETPEDRNR